MKMSLIIFSCLFIHAFCGCPSCMGLNTFSVDPSSAYFIGLEYSFTKRDGFYDFQELHSSQARKRNDLSMFGCALGKRYKINESARFQIGVDLAIGAVTDDTFSNVHPASVKYFFYHGGIEPQIQFPFAKIEGVQPYFLLGGGLNYIYITEHTYFIDDKREVLYTGLAYVNAGCFSLSASAGLGFDWAMTDAIFLNFWYSFRYWQPVRYNIREDFLLDDMPYRETFYSNRFHLTLLFNIK
jgi:hypothetical protein